MTTSVIIADDEPLARARIHELLAPHPEYRVIAECEDGNSALNAVLEQKPDLLFLDIRMPGMDGMELASVLENTHSRPVIVFVTAFDEFAVGAFDAGAIDYLRKLFDQERFDRALQRVGERLARPAAAMDTALRVALESMRRDGALAERFLVRGHKGMYFVRVADVDWLDAQGNYVRLHAGGKAHLIRETMKSVEQKLNTRQFVRVNRSVIVNIDHIASVETHAHGEYALTLRDSARVISSRSYGARLHVLLG